jgi:hypothetical protein
MEGWHFAVARGIRRAQLGPIARAFSRDLGQYAGLSAGGALCGRVAALLLRAGLSAGGLQLLFPACVLRAPLRAVFQLWGGRISLGTETAAVLRFWPQPPPQQCADCQGGPGRVRENLRPCAREPTRA